MRAVFLLGAGLLVASTFRTSAGEESQAVATRGMVIAQEEPPEVVIVTSRFREEDVQAVPVAVSVIGQQKLEDTGTYNVAQLTQLTPSLQFFSSNPRNTVITIRGLGTSFGPTNDGLESGVGLYIDQVYFSRPAAATFDLLDVERVEVLRGPQGTLFGKNTTAGAINIVIQEPTFERQVHSETTIGNYGYVQGKASISGPLVGTVLAGRLSVQGTLRDGLIHNTTTGKDIMGQSDFGVRGQLLYRPGERFSLRLVGDYNHTHSICCPQVFVDAGATLKPAAQQFPALAAAAAYSPVSLDPFERKTDANSPAHADEVLGGISAIANYDFGAVTLTSVSAWRTWNHDAASDRDFIKLSINTQSVNPDNQNQYSQEFRLTSNGPQKIDYVVGLYGYWQRIRATPIAEFGADATHWLLTPLTLPGNLLDGYISNAIADSTHDSYAAFGQATWNTTDKLQLTLGLRYTYEQKKARFDQVVSGGLQTTDPALIAKKLSILRPQSYSANPTDGSLSGLFDVAYDITRDIHAYATYSTGFKSGGINLAGIPSDANGNPLLSTAEIKPENVSSYELGLKNQFFNGRLTLNLALFDTIIRDYQVNVVDSGPGALRGYLSNIKQVSAKGLELESAFTPFERVSGYFSAALTEGKYESFTNGPCPLELISASTVACDLSGRPLPGLPKWALSVGGEYRHPIGEGFAYFGVDASYRSSQYSDASDSKYLRINGYGLVNLRAGYASAGPWEAFVWVKNLFDERYYSYLSAQPGNSGAVFGLPGDPRTFGVTLRITY